MLGEESQLLTSSATPFVSWVFRAFTYNARLELILWTTAASESREVLSVRMLFRVQKTLTVCTFHVLIPESVLKTSSFSSGCCREIFTATLFIWK